MSVFLKSEDLARKYGVSHFAIKQAIRASKGSQVVMYRPDREGGYFIAPEDETKVTALLLNPHKARKRKKTAAAKTESTEKSEDDNSQQDKAGTQLQGANIQQVK